MMKIPGVKSENTPPPSPAGGRIRNILVFAALLALVLYAAIPRTVDMRRFDPEKMALRETAMWRCYYEGQWLGLGWNLYQIMRREFGFSPLDSARLAWDMGKAAHIFRKSLNRTEAEKSIPPLVRCYETIRARSRGTFDPVQAARLELEWWQLRRELAGENAVSGVLSDLVKITNETTDPRVDEAARLRVAAMEYRDARRRKKMTDEEWMHIASCLTGSYSALFEAVSAGGNVP